MAIKLRPSTLEQVPVYSTIRSDSAPAISAILTDLETGNFTSAALLIDGMMRDDRITAVMHTRTAALASLPLDIQPAKKTALAKQAAQALEEMWTMVFPDSLLSELIRWGQMLGIAVAHVTWERNDHFGWLPSLEVWHPKHIRWDWLERGYYAYHTEGEARVIPGHEWLIYTPHGREYGWRRGLLLSLANLWLMRQWTWRDWARASEVYGLPIRKAFVPADAKPKEKDQFLREVANLGNESAIKIPRSDQGASYDVDMLEVKGDLHKAFADFIDAINSSIAITVLGQNLSTEIKGGSFAAAQAHEAIRADRLGSDAETMSVALYDQVIREWAFRVYGRDDVAPYPQWQFEPAEDKFKKTQFLVTLSQAITQFQNAGAPIDTREMLANFDVPMIPEPTKPVAPEPMEPNEELPSESEPLAQIPNQPADATPKT